MSYPWDRLPAEPATAYAAFLFYLHLGRGRALADAYDAYLLCRPERPLPKCQPATAPWWAWSRKHDWGRRAACYDRDRPDGPKARDVIAIVHHLIGEGVSRSLSPGWQEHLDYLRFLAQLVAPVRARKAASEDEPVPVARVYSAKELLDRAGGVSPNNPGRPLEPSTASASPHGARPTE
jgi:hypothetical protein